VQVSSVSGAGLEELRATLDGALEGVDEPVDVGRPRLGVDRVFTMSGFGTVVTGTLLGGRLAVGETLEASPDGPTARIRGLQTHRREVLEAQPGTRVAVNLAGVATEALRRGQVLAPPGRMSRVAAFDAQLRVLAHRPLTHNLRVAVHTGAAEAQGRVRILEGDAIDAGERGWAQVVLSSPLACSPGDLFVLRVSDETIGGGRVVAINPPRHRRSDAETIARLDRLATGTPESEALAALERREPATAEQLLGAVELSAEALRTALAELAASGDVVAVEAEGAAVYATSAGITRFREAAGRALAAYHAEYPLRFTMPREELRSRLRVEPRAFAAVLAALPELAGRGDGVTEANWEPRPTAEQSRSLAAIEATLGEAGLQAPRLDADAELIAHLVAAGRAVDCGDGVVVSSEAFAEAAGVVRRLIEAQGPLSLAAARDALATNRRVAQALLETLDRRGVTRRQGEARVLTAARPVPGA
jgi:selenocysteine-specific elongation factor